MLTDKHDETGAPEKSRASSREEEHLSAHGLYRIGFAYGRFIFAARWIIVALWVVGLAVSIPFTMKVGSVLTGGGYNFSGSESVKADNIMSSKLNLPKSQVYVVFQSDTVAATDPAFQAEVNDFIARASTFPGVTSATQAGLQPASLDGKTTFVAVNFDVGAETVQHRLDDFRTLLPNAGPARAYVTGDPAVYETFNKITEEDTRTAEMTALPIALLVLLVVFGTLVAALMPLLLALVAVPVALALIYAIALHTQTSVFVTNVASIVGLGISIDYSLFMVRRFRDELAQGRTVRDAIGWTVATAGEAILFSGTVVMIGFIGLVLIGIQFMTSFGIGGAVVVASAVLAALTLLPALMAILGPRINALHIPLIGRFMTSSRARHERGGFWHRLAMGVMRHPVPIIIGTTALLLALSWPVLSINIGSPSASTLPKTTEARQGLDILQQQFPHTAQNPVMVVVQSPDGSSMLAPYNVTKVANLSDWIAQQDHVTSVTSLTNLPSTGQGPSLDRQQLIALYSSGQYEQVPALAQLVSSTTKGDTTVITAASNTTLDSPEGKALIDNLRAGGTDAAQGLTVYVGGFQAVSLDFNRYLYDNFPNAILFILSATFVLLLIMFRSLLIPLKAILMNVLSVGAAYGVLVFVFQWGNFSNILRFTSDGTVDSTIPILLFCILFGLSMDYEVFLLSRIREEWLRTHNNRFAVAMGLERTGAVITNAALLFVIVTGAFTFTRIIITKQVGLGMTVAVLVDATIIRSLLVPATMRLLGRWNWWLPGRPVPVERPLEEVERMEAESVSVTPGG
jgi:RND superfamily putative drug exporter